MTFKELRKNYEGYIPIRQAAKELGISKTALFNYETHKKFPRINMLKKIQEKYLLTNDDIASLYLDYFLNNKEM